eukprot:m.13689 g.13689  ORF g.13689 m.13689 type:complete len:221 (+) comp4902_c0_seq1:93-755(+)
MLGNVNPKPLALTVFGLSFFLWLFLVIGTASKSYMYGDTGREKFHVGIFKSKAGDVVESYPCDRNYADCPVGDTCGASRFFSVTSILVCTAAVAGAVCLLGPQFIDNPMLVSLGKMVPDIVPTILFAVTAFLAFIVWACMASAKDKINKCFKKDDITMHLGGGFGLFIVSWMMAMAGSYVCFFATKNRDAAHGNSNLTLDDEVEPELPAKGMDYAAMIDD